ncbi:HNH nuclease [Fusarium austroafricanum]|uniref:HNH nuclease n=1 Tax=Fusarium austroafricanum TaxID=2364996 RepID=A0A8H4NHM7_9HYPO|nr:HNH nuclease [Fusarium austroafricanum]
MQFYMLLNLPPEELSNMWIDLVHSDEYRYCLNNVGPFISYFLQHSQYIPQSDKKRKADSDPALNAAQKEIYDEHEALKKELAQLDASTSDRSTKEQTTCKEYDGYRCIVTGAANPQACHIIPFAINNSETNLQKTFRFNSELKTDDKTKSAIKLQFHWMPRNIKRGPPNSAQSSLWAELYICSEEGCQACDDTKAIAAHNIDTGCPIRTGDIFIIIRDTADIPFCQRAMDMQWAVITAAAISGGALIPDQLGDFDDGPDDTTVTYEDLKGIFKDEA